MGILIIGGTIFLINITGLSGTDQLSFLLLSGCVFWMIAYIVTHINVLILRKRLPKVPRTFKAPFTPALQIVGILGTLWMIYNIDSDAEIRMRIYRLCLFTFIPFVIYAFVWVKKVVKKPLFKAYPVSEVMAMEHELYWEHHRKK